MKISYTLLPLVSLVANAQDVHVPSTCVNGTSPGTSVVIATVPYTYTQVLSVISSFKNLTWSGNPDDTVTLNGTNNTPGTARTYELAGAHVVETLISYLAPPAPGPYQELHNTAPLTVPAYNVSAYIVYDGTVVSEACGGKAATFNFTANFCASNVQNATQLLDTLHSMDAAGASKLLGGQNFTSCEALGASGSAPGPTSTMASGAPSSTGTSAPVSASGGAASGSALDSSAMFTALGAISFAVAFAGL